MECSIGGDTSSKMFLLIQIIYHHLLWLKNLASFFSFVKSSKCCCLSLSFGFHETFRLRLATNYVRKVVSKVRVTSSTKLFNSVSVFEPLISCTVMLKSGIRSTETFKLYCDGNTSWSLYHIILSTNSSWLSTFWFPTTPNLPMENCWFSSKCCFYYSWLMWWCDINVALYSSNYPFVWLSSGVLNITVIVTHQLIGSWT